MIYTCVRSNSKTTVNFLINLTNCSSYILIKILPFILAAVLYALLNKSNFLTFAHQNFYNSDLTKYFQHQNLYHTVCYVYATYIQHTAYSIQYTVQYHTVSYSVNLHYGYEYLLVH